MFMQIVKLACFCALAVAAFASQKEGPKRVFVETFTTKAGAEKFRADVVAELRKQNAIALVASQSSADAILGGGGEIWVKGYRSLNPRSGRSPSNGTPVYGGYLAVELRDAKGDTLWTDLVTPPTGSEDVSKDLAKRIAKDVALALEHPEPALPKASQPQTATTLKGAGATFPYLVYSKWFTNYKRENPNVEISYENIGSEAGVRKLLRGEVDFGASDSPEAIREIAPGDDSKYLLFPSVAGAIVPIVNLPGVPEEIAFTPEILAGIYLGRIKKWNDPLLQQANRRVRLPDLDIVVIHRGDGSGTSYAWTDFLCQTSPDWKAQVGSSLAPQWPTGRPATGNDGVAKLVKELGGSIGYVQFIYALQNHLSFGKVRNRNGEFISASLESIAVAVSQSSKTDDEFKGSIVNAPGAGAYPISTFTWLVVPTHVADQAKRTAIMGFLKWILGPGQRQAAAFGYLALPRDLVGAEEKAISRIQ
jgi:phosphate transport system substrate-binding protein